jgi:hypothetical protein
MHDFGSIGKRLRRAIAMRLESDNEAIAPRLPISKNPLSTSLLLNYLFCCAPTSPVSFKTRRHSNQLINQKLNYRIAPTPITHALKPIEINGWTPLFLCGSLRLL